MNLQLVFLFSITLSFARNYSLDQRFKYILNELADLETIFKSSNYWKDRYDRDLKLYTARVDDYTGTCTKSIFECFYKEFEVLLEEISLLGEEDIAKNFNHTLSNIMSYNLLESKVPNNCKKCEEYEEKPVFDFINSFKSIAQKILHQKKL